MSLDISSTDLSQISNLEAIAAKKTILVELENLMTDESVQPFWEGMVLAPSDDNTNASVRIIIASNNYFNVNIDNLVLTLTLDIERRNVLETTFETEDILDKPLPPFSGLEGRAESAKVWIHPSDPSRSLIFAAHGTGLTNAKRRNRRFDELHGIVDSHTCCHNTTW